MAKRTNGPPTATPPTASQPAARVEAPPRTPEPAAEKRRPASYWKYSCSPGVTVEVTAWPNEITLQSGETITLFNMTISRCYRDENGQWHEGGSFRSSELPTLVHALQKAHAFATDAREMDCPL